VTALVPGLRGALRDDAMGGLRHGVEGGARRRFLYLCVARVMVCTVLFGATVGVHLAEGNSLDAPTPQLLLRVVLGIYMVSLGYIAAVLRLPQHRLRALTITSIGLDLVAWTVLSYATGGLGSPLSTLYALSTLTAAMVLGGRAPLWTAVLGLMLFGCMGIFMGAGVLVPLPDKLHVADPIEGTYQAVVTLTAVLAFTAISGQFVDRIVLADDALVRAEASRATLAAIYEDVLRSIPVVLVTFDARGLIDSANPNCARLLGVPLAQLLGTDVRTHFPFLPDVALSRGDNGRVVPQAVTGDATVEADGAPLRVSFRLAPLRDRDEAVRGGVLVLEDRSAEETLRAQVESAERFAELGRLAAGLAHEIRNPLGAISGCVELVRESQGLDAEDRDLLASVSKDVLRLNDLVTEMLFFARPRPPERVPCDLDALTREVLRLAKADVRVSGVDVRFEGGAPLPTVRCDPAQLRQVLWNLLRNAAQVTRPGEAVDVSLDADEGAVTLSVADRGPGVPEAMRSRIFEAYYSGSARGAGIGLAIVKRIADAHGATLDVLEREGGGSVFALRLPLDGGAA
jgi:two-component system sensor histidine kinase PilS (NtrC family)